MLKERYALAWNERILDLIAGIIARFIVGAGAAILFAALVSRGLVRLAMCHPEVLLIPAGVGVY